jgi:hypothetical protein
MVEITLAAPEPDIDCRLISEIHPQETALDGTFCRFEEQP